MALLSGAFQVGLYGEMVVGEFVRTVEERSEGFAFGHRFGNGFEKGDSVFGGFQGPAL